MPSCPGFFLMNALAAANRSSWVHPHGLAAQEAPAVPGGTVGADPAEVAPPVAAAAPCGPPLSMPITTSTPPATTATTARATSAVRLRGERANGYRAIGRGLRTRSRVRIQSASTPSFHVIFLPSSRD